MQTDARQATEVSCESLEFILRGKENPLEGFPQGEPRSDLPSRKTFLDREKTGNSCLRGKETRWEAEMPAPGWGQRSGLKGLGGRTCKPSARVLKTATEHFTLLPPGVHAAPLRSAVAM